MNQPQQPKPSEEEYRRYKHKWWYRDPNGEWKQLGTYSQGSTAGPPPTLLEYYRGRESAAAGGPILPLVIGTAAVLIALGGAFAVFGEDADSITKVLAPVLTAIGAFTGHAAGHAAAKAKKP